LQVLHTTGNPLKVPMTLEQYNDYITKIKTKYEQEWSEYFMIIAIINERYIDIYRMFN